MTRSDRYSIDRSPDAGGAEPADVGRHRGVLEVCTGAEPPVDAVTIATCVSLSAPTSSIASRNGTMTSNDMAFIRSGRLSVTTLTWGRGLVIWT